MNIGSIGFHSTVNTHDTYVVHGMSLFSLELDVVRKIRTGTYVQNEIKKKNCKCNQIENTDST